MQDIYCQFLESVIVPTSSVALLSHFFVLLESSHTIVLTMLQGSLIFPKTPSTTSEESELPEVSSLDHVGNGETDS
jgi:hypothetical protein